MLISRAERDGGSGRKGTRTRRENSLLLKRIAKDGGAAKVDQLHDALLADHDVVELEVAVRQPHAMQVQHAAQDLQRGARHLGT